MNDGFVEKMRDADVVHDSRLLADFVQIFCDEHHGTSARSLVTTDGASLGVYGRKTPTLCAECEEHLAYAENRRAFCPKDPKPFCAHCDTHCYREEERIWQREMMRFSGPKSWRKGHAVDGIKHVLSARKWRREMERRSAEAGAD